MTSSGDESGQVWLGEKISESQFCRQVFPGLRGVQEAGGLPLPGTLAGEPPAFSRGPSAATCLSGTELQRWPA